MRHYAQESWDLGCVVGMFCSTVFLKAEKTLLHGVIYECDCQSKCKRIRKHLLLLYWLRQSLWLFRSQQTVENSSRYGNTRPSYLPSEKSVCRSRSSSWNRICNNRLVLNWERSMSWLYTVTLLILLLCRAYHVKSWAGWSTSWNQDGWEKYQ